VIPDLFARACRGRRAALLVGAVAISLIAAAGPAAAGPAAAGRPADSAEASATGELPSPPKAPARPGLPTRYTTPTALTRSAAAGAQTTAVTTPSRAKTWGQAGASTTLVLYDTTGEWGWLGELYAIGAGNLATHFGTVTAEPVADYVAGQVNDYTTTIYLGSTYNEPIPSTFLNDALDTTHSIIWVGDNVWQLTGSEGSTADTAFESKYGWDPSSSYFDETDSVSTVAYKGQDFTRSPDNTAGILAPHITDASDVQTLATANCATACATIAQTSGSSFPWAINSSNLMYVGEIPFSYMSMTDRYVIFSDLLFNDLDPTATPSHLALVRLEDISPESSPSDLTAMAAYLKSQGVPFSMAVIPQYTDPNGYYNNGVPVSASLLTKPSMVSALKTAVADGGTIVQHGDTHQYSNVDNPFDGVTGDDFEFYRAQCATTDSAPYTYQAPCPATDYVIENGPVPGDSYAWAMSRVVTGRSLFTLSGLPTPTIWTTPHYAASAADYSAIDSVYKVRYEQELFFGGQLSGTAIDYSHVFGQFFPYEVHDLYGTTIIPENLGDYEPVEQNNNPPRTAADMLAEGQLNTAVTQGVASFFIHPDDDPLSVLEQMVTGLKSEGYTFVSPAGLMAENG
jgi:uncharacterized protein YdaL